VGVKQKFTYLPTISLPFIRALLTAADDDHYSQTTGIMERLLRLFLSQCVPFAQSRTTGGFIVSWALSSLQGISRHKSSLFFHISITETTV
jgi:hypothetical protein